MKISKNVKLYAVVWAILLILFNVIVFVTPSEINGESKFTQTFWIGYVLTTLGFIAQLVCTFISLNDDSADKVFFNLPLLRTSFIGLIVSAVAGSVFMAIPTAPSWISALICLACAAFVAIACIKAKSAGDIASSVEKKIAELEADIEELNKLIEEGDVLTCRGLGKCVVKEVPGQSRKGRTMLILERYL